jgi:hypothetical protein
MRPHNTEAIRSDMTGAHPDTARQARRIAGLRGNSLGISLMLIAEYGLGIGVNLYVHIPAADRGNGIASALGRALTSQPVVLAVHAGLGLLLLVAAVNVLTRAIRARHRFAIAASVTGLPGGAGGPASARLRSGHRLLRFRRAGAGLGSARGADRQHVPAHQRRVAGICRPPADPRARRGSPTLSPAQAAAAEQVVGAFWSALGRNDPAASAKRR